MGKEKIAAIHYLKKPLKYLESLFFGSQENTTIVKASEVLPKSDQPNISLNNRPSSVYDNIKQIVDSWNLMTPFTGESEIDESGAIKLLAEGGDSLKLIEIYFE